MGQQTNHHRQSYQCQVHNAQSRNSLYALQNPCYHVAACRTGYGQKQTVWGCLSTRLQVLLIDLHNGTGGTRNPWVYAEAGTSSASEKRPLGAETQALMAMGNTPPPYSKFQTRIASSAAPGQARSSLSSDLRKYILKSQYHHC